MALDAQKAPALARRVAWDVMRYDQQGCYSPHVFYVQRGGPVSPRDFAGYLAGELSNLQRRFPRRALDLEESAAVAKWRQSIEWTLTPDGADALIGDMETAGSVAYVDEAASLAPTALQRSITVAGIDALDEVAPLVASRREFLQTAGASPA
ncbi:hypothetical protein G6F32_014584 [Rhizopus arrhizus]|nr:hypothetical protein G6F32_014584 [Rhizopus arrhizus]